MSKYIISRKREVKGLEQTQYLAFIVDIPGFGLCPSMTDERQYAKVFISKNDAETNLPIAGKGAIVEPYKQKANKP